VYVPQRTWIENGPDPRPRRRCGLGALACAPGEIESPANAVCVPAPENVDVVACSPDICFNFGFPWVGRRWELPPNTNPANLNGRVLNSSCYCKPVFEVGGWGTWITAGVIGLIAVSLLKGGRQ
jgi:hypothetical protein